MFYSADMKMKAKHCCVCILAFSGTLLDIFSGTDKVRYSGLGPDPDLSAKSGPE